MKIVINLINLTLNAFKIGVPGYTEIANNNSHLIHLKCGPINNEEFNIIVSKFYSLEYLEISAADEGKKLFLVI